MKQILNRLLCCFLMAFSFSSAATALKDGVNLFNQMEFKQAKVVFEPLAKQGDASAMLWLGVTQFRTGEQFQAGMTLLKSAEAGNPWAMLMMSPEDNGYCGYLGWPCDQSWRDKAFSVLERLADQGNGNAICTLLYRKGKPWWTYVPILNKQRGGELAEKGVKNGWYSMASCGIPMSIEKKVELLQYVAAQGYAPAMVELYYIDYRDEYNIKNSSDFLKESLRLGYPSSVENLLYNARRKYFKINELSDFRNMTEKEKLGLEDVYYYSLIGKEFGLNNIILNMNKPVKNSEGEFVLVSLLSSEEQLSIEEKAKKFLGQVKPNLFLSESSNMNALLNP